MPDTQVADMSAVQLVTPDLYVLSGGGIQVHYATTGFAGQPHFTYHDAFRTLTFTGNQIRVVPVPDLGTLVSVTIVMTVDSGSTTFSLLLPAVQLATGAGPGSVSISTDGITTMHRFSVVPVLNHGQREFYTVTPMTGTASHVVFLHSLLPTPPPHETRALHPAP